MNNEKKEPKKRGRKPFLFDDVLAQKFENFCKIGCSIEEIAANFDIDSDTLKKQVSKHYNLNFSVVFAQKREIQKTILRKKRMEKALQGDTAMLIYLSKNILGETDRQSIDVSFDIDYSQSKAPDFTNE